MPALSVLFFFIIERSVLIAFNLSVVQVPLQKLIKQIVSHHQKIKKKLSVITVLDSTLGINVNVMVVVKLYSLGVFLNYAMSYPDEGCGPWYIQPYECHVRQG